MWDLTFYPANTPSLQKLIRQPVFASLMSSRNLVDYSVDGSVF